MKIQDWACKWRMMFNPDLVKQTLEVVFSKKINPSIYLSLFYNNSKIEQTKTEKTSWFKSRPKIKISVQCKIKNKNIYIFKRWPPSQIATYILARTSLLTIVYKASFMINFRMNLSQITSTFYKKRSFTNSCAY